MFRSRRPNFAITMPRAALEKVFDECDRHNVDETGGRLIGTYRERDGGLEIEVSGIIGPGPNARRSPTSFFQDGDYQEQVFRSVEQRHPDIEHLGNWHTHHVNGYPTLSGGDKETYARTVNHKNHNTDFFYALLVVHKNPSGSPRYETKHFVLRRGDDSVYEIPHGKIHTVDRDILWPQPEARSVEVAAAEGEGRGRNAANVERAKDAEFFADHYPKLKPLLARSSGAPYWKGGVELIDGSEAVVVALEDGNGTPSYSITAASEHPEVSRVVAAFKDRHFKSARQGVVAFERDANRAIHKAARAAR